MAYLKLMLDEREIAYLSEDETFEDTTRGRARRIMAEYQKPVDTN